jgi:Zn-dependent protease
MLVALAGPGSNALLAVGTAVVWWALRRMEIVGEPGRITPQEWILAIGVQMNFVLAIFNLLPIPTLDGSRVIGFFLPRRLAYSWYDLDRYGFIFVLMLVVLPSFSSGVNPLGWLVWGAVDPLLHAVKSFVA